MSRRRRKAVDWHARYTNLRRKHAELRSRFTEKVNYELAKNDEEVTGRIERLDEMREELSRRMASAQELVTAAGELKDQLFADRVRLAEERLHWKPRP